MENTTVVLYGVGCPAGGGGGGGCRSSGPHSRFPRCTWVGHAFGEIAMGQPPAALVGNRATASGSPVGQPIAGMGSGAGGRGWGNGGRMSANGGRGWHSWPAVLKGRVGLTIGSPVCQAAAAILGRSAEVAKGVSFNATPSATNILFIYIHIHIYIYI